MNFRVRNLQSNEWMDPSRCFVNGLGELYTKRAIGVKKLTDVYEVSRDVGLFDRDDIPVYEKDIVEVWSASVDSDEMKVVDRCVVVDSSIGFVAVSIVKPKHDSDSFWYDMEKETVRNCFSVISNIYDYEPEDDEVDVPGQISIDFG